MFKKKRPNVIRGNALLDHVSLSGMCFEIFIAQSSMIESGIQFIFHMQ